MLVLASSRVHLPVLLFCSCLVLCATALAQESAEQGQAKAADDTLDAEARALFQAGELAFQQGRFQNAMEYFTRAYELSGRPGLLYNIGNAADRLRKDAEALAAFEQYLEEKPDAPNRAAVEARIAVLRQRAPASADEAAEDAGPAEAQPADEQAAEPQADEPEPQEEEEAPPAAVDEQPAAEDASSSQEADTAGAGAWPWIVAGAGVALAGGGAALLVIGTGQISDVEGAELGSQWSDFEGDADSGPTLATVGAVLVGVGGAALVTGVVWLALGGGTDEQAPISMMPGGLCMHGRF